MTRVAVIDERIAPWWAATASLAWIACGAIYLTLPPSPDQFELDYMGWQMLEGAVPYRDFIDMNWPGVMWLHALSTALFGNQLWSWRALDFIVVAMSAFFLHDLLKRSAGIAAAALSLVLYPLFYASLPQWFSGQPDMTAGAFLLVAVWFQARAYDKPDWREQIGVGIFIAAAMLNKPTLGVLGPLLALQALVAGAPLRRVAVHTLVAAAAAVATLLLALGAVLTQGTSLGELIDAVYTYNIWTQFLEAATLEELARSWVTVHIVSWHYLSALAVAGAIWLYWRAPRSTAATALPVLWLAAVLSFAIQHRGFAYHLGPCFIAIIGLTAATLGLCAEAGLARRPRSWPATAGVLLILSVIAGGVKKLHTNYPGLPAALLQGDYSQHLARYVEGDGLTVADALELTERIRRTVPADETVLVLGTASSMNFLSRRAQPTRFFYAPVLVNMRPPLPIASRWTDLLEGDLKRTRPRWCLIGTWARKEWLDGDSRGARFLRDYLHAHYRKTGFVGSGEGLEIYERK